MTNSQDQSVEGSSPGLAPEHELSALDADFVRVLEDLLDALLAKGTLLVTDLPPHALEKLQARKQARQRLKNALDLIDDAPLI
ncbi:hypothetical protein [Ottowia caeni]|uniref:hypothetical protein n=1 Tax=Ottowia caeni TaxID=2870339 RepID=UPI001E32FE54|nr:hypothetical protein [Ottowia caeni]